MIEIINLKDEPEHLTTLASWHHSEWSTLNPGESLDDRIIRMQPHLNEAFIPSTFVAKDNNLLGSAAIVSQDMETNLSLTPWLASVYVTPQYRRHGVGRKLVKHVMTQSKLEGINKLYLFTPDKQNFYLKLGWTKKHTERYHDQKVTVMQVALDKI